MATLMEDDDRELQRAQVRASIEQMRATVENMHAEAGKFQAEQRKLTREWKQGPYVLAASIIVAIGGFTVALSTILRLAH
jgi:phage-related protein